ncbi:MAG: hypothetical protein IJ190_09210 [Prevotella sp.]|nr:hypothetical protein [Prevotella sp.]
MRLLRNILNTIFVIGAAVGMATYYWGNKELGTYIIIGAMAFKFFEVVMRLLKLEDKS